MGEGRPYPDHGYTTPKEWASLPPRPVRLDELQLNFSPAEVVGPEWHFDTWRYPLGWEAPGPPERCGPWETACELVRDYEFSSPDLVRAVYDERECLDGRNMLLEARFYGMRFYLGVRVTEIIDANDAS